MERPEIAEKAGFARETKAKYYIIMIIIALCRAADLLKCAGQGSVAFYRPMNELLIFILLSLPVAAPAFAAGEGDGTLNGEITVAKTEKRK